MTLAPTTHAALVTVLCCLTLPASGQETKTADANHSLNAVTDAEGVLVSQAGVPVLRYQRATRSFDGQWPRANYIHPLFDLSGNVISEDFPEDHRHHRGIFWAWHQVWIGDQKAGDSWLCKDFVWDVTDVATKVSDHSIAVLATVEWKSPRHNDNDKLMALVREQTKITTHTATPTHRLIDFEISLRALVDGVRIGGSEDVKGYGGFSPRILLRDEMRFSSSSGEIEPTKTAVEADKWIDIAADDYGVAILTHHSNPEPRNRFILRRKRSMQNAMFPGREPFPISKTDPTVLRYRLVIHRGDMNAAQITALQHAFDQEN